MSIQDTIQYRTGVVRRTVLVYVHQNPGGCRSVFCNGCHQQQTAYDGWAQHAKQRTHLFVFLKFVRHCSENHLRHPRENGHRTEDD